MKSSALRCYDQAEPAPVHLSPRRAKLYLASVRSADGSVATFDPPYNLSACASYAYDPLKQITQVNDDQNNLTRIRYDHLGRRTGIDNPDTGFVETVYDLASNPVQKITAVLNQYTDNN